MKKNSVPFRLRALVWCALASAAAAQTTTRVSVSSFGVEANGPSLESALSGDGRFVSFQSFASNLVAEDKNGKADIFVHDRALRVTTRVSVSSSGVEGDDDSGSGASSGAVSPLSADGRYIIFESLATNLVSDDTNGVGDIFLHDRLTSETTRVSVASGGGQADGASRRPRLSADARFLVFESDATNLVPGDTNGATDIFLHDRQSGLTRRVSVNSQGEQGNSFSITPDISDDGRVVGFSSAASNLAPDDTNGSVDAFAYDQQSATLERISVTSAGAQVIGLSALPAISADGRFIAFISNSNDFEPGKILGEFDIFVRDRTLGTTVRASVDSNGIGGESDSFDPDISSDGRFVVFRSEANLARGNGGGVFIRDLILAQTSRADLSSVGAPPAQGSDIPTISGDSHFVTFANGDPGLVTNDSNGVTDVFVRTLLPLLPPQPFPADSQPAAIAIANFDVDLDVFKRGDLAVVNAGANSVSLLDNNGVPGQPPSFAPPSPERTFPVGAGPTAAAPGNLDDNVYPDLIVANTAGGTVSILLGAAIGGFTAGQTLVTPGAPRALSLADIDRDGWQDIIVARRDADAISFFRNLGFGVFGPDQPQAVPPGGRPSGVGSGDLDNDKDVDVVASLDQAGAILVFPNTSPINGPFSFGPTQSFAVGAGSPRAAALVLSDFDFDGFLDVAVAVKNNGVIAVLRNLGNTEGGVWLGFAPPVSFATGSLPVSIGAGNVYGFGFPDLFTANAFVDANNLSSVSVLKNVTTGPGHINFEPEVRIETPPLAAHITAFDVNLDNRLDIAVATGFDAGGLLDSAGAPARATPRGVTTGVAAVLAGASPSVALAPCDGDANGDRYADFVDLNIVLGYYATPGPAVPGDLNADGVVDFLDLNIVLSAFGSAC